MKWLRRKPGTMIYFSFVRLNQAFSYNLNTGSRQRLDTSYGSKEEIENLFLTVQACWKASSQLGGQFNRVTTKLKLTLSVNLNLNGGPSKKAAQLSSLPVARR